MPRFVFVFRGGAAEYPLSPTEMQAHMEHWYAWIDKLQSQPLQASGVALDPRGKTLRGKDKSLTDGPYAESKDLVTGSMSIEAATLEQAVEIARGCPVFLDGGSVEVRQVTEITR